MTFTRLHRPRLHMHYHNQPTKKSRPAYSGKGKPLVNITESSEDFVLSIAAPGLNKSDFAIGIDKQVLTVSVEKKSQEESEYKIREFDFNNFERKFELPQIADTERVEASYETGILTIKIAKKLEAQPKAINVK